MKKSSVLDSKVKVSYIGGKSVTPSSREETKHRKSASKVSAGTRSVIRKVQKSETRSSTNVMSNECIGAAISERAKTVKEIDAITGALVKNCVLARLTDEDRYAIIEKMLFIAVEAGKVIYEVDNTPTYFYIVHAGNIAELSNGEKIAELQRGDSFGELALINRSPRKTTVRAISRSQLWALDRESFNQALERVNRTTYEENFAFVSSVPLFQMLTKNEIDVLLSSMTELKYIVGQKIIKEGDSGDLFYVIKDGTVLCTQGGVELRHMHKGEFFGEQALLYNSPRTATVTAVEKVVRCLALGRDVLVSAIGDHLNNVIYRNSVKVAFTRSQVFSFLTQEQADLVSNNCKFQEFEPGEVVIPADSPAGESVWFILKGTIASSTDRVDSLTTFGDNALIAETTDTYPEYTAAVPNTYVAFITRNSIEELVNCSITKLISKNEAMTALRNVELYHSLSPSKFSALTSLLVVESFEAGEVVFQVGTPAESFYIIKSGSVNALVNDTVVRTMPALSYFGERAMLQREPRTATVVANEKTECWVLKREDFFSVIDDHITKILLKKIDLQDDQVSLNDLQMIRSLGSGMFGKVYLTQHRTKRVRYALKVVEKARVLKLDTWEGLLLERDILLQLDHIFVMKLVKTIKDEAYVYFLMEYVPGMDFFDVIRQLGILSDQDARFYISCLLLTLEYLQEKKVIYRDLKPENIIIDEDGYPKLIDFGTAKVVEGRTYTIIGTPHYMAPEVIAGKGYNHSADLWSLGVILYELLCGGLPFGENDEDPYEVYQKILTERLKYPSFIGAKLKCKTLIDTLCNRNPALRSGGRVQRLKSHAWFATVNWVSPSQEDLLVKKVDTPFLPDVRAPSEPMSQQAVRILIDVRLK